MGLSTGPAAKWPRSVLSGPIFSGPVDCAVLVNFFKQLIFNDNLRAQLSTSTLVAFG